MTLLTVSALLTIVALAACLVPAARAVGTDPAIVLRAE
jgi:ABC-type lipoprotein release transport system permease subunit